MARKGRHVKIRLLSQKLILRLTGGWARGLRPSRETGLVLEFVWENSISKERWTREETQSREWFWAKDIGTGSQILVPCKVPDLFSFKMVSMWIKKIKKEFNRKTL